MDTSTRDTCLAANTFSSYGDERSYPADKCIAFEYATRRWTPAIVAFALTHIAEHHPERWSPTRGVLSVSTDDPAVRDTPDN